FYGLQPATYTVSVSLFGYETTSQQIVINNAETDTLDFSLQPLPTGSLLGRAFNPMTNLPYSNFRFRLLSPAQGYCISNDSGYFSLDLLPVGHYLAYAEFNNYYPQDTVEFAITAGDTTLLSVTMGSNFGRVEAVLRENLTNAPIAGAVVTCDGLSQTVTSNSQGIVSFQHLQFGQYTLRVDHPPYLPDSIVVTVNSSNSYSSYSWYLERNPIELVDSLDSQPGMISSVKFSPNGSLIASGGSEANVRIWSATDGTLLHELPSQHHEVTCIAFSPDGRFLAAGTWDGVIMIWRVPEGTLHQALTTHNAKIEKVEFTPDGLYLGSCSQSSGLLLHRVSDWSLNRTFAINQPTSFSFSPNGLYVAAISEQYLTVHRMSDGTVFFQDHSWGVSGEVCYSSTGMYLAAGYYYGLVLFSAYSTHYRANGLYQPPLYNNYNTLEFAPTSPLIAATGDQGVITFWNANHYRFYTSIPTNNMSINSISFSRDGRMFLTGGSDGVVRIWRVLVP
ncbi:MAG: hypothetical protein OEM52_11215, partial [bacterium]|nr:hypothetical protein [bacterium]